MPDADPTSPWRERSSAASGPRASDARRSTAIVHRDVHDDFLARFTKAVTDAPIGDPTGDVPCTVRRSPRGSPSGSRGGSTDPSAPHRVGIEATGDHRRELAHRVRRRRRRRLYYHPTIVDGVTIDDDLYRTETFGPIVGVASFDTFDDAIKLANGHGYGLSSSIYTNDLLHVFRFRDSISAGMVSGTTRPPVPARTCRSAATVGQRASPASGCSTSSAALARR